MTLKAKISTLKAKMLKNVELIYTKDPKKTPKIQTNLTLKAKISTLKAKILTLTTKMLKNVELIYTKDPKKPQNPDKFDLKTKM